MNEYTTSESTQEIPAGYCLCGCGKQTKIIPYSSKRRGWIKGQPMRFLHGHNTPVIDLADRFWAKVDKSAGLDSCWIWTGFLDRKGYGDFHTAGKGKSCYAHRVAYELTNGPVENNLEVCHACDNPACVNPAHLWLGTHAENMRDSVSKNRQARGERNGQSIVTAEEVIAIRKRYASGNVSQSQLAREYGVCQANIYKIVHRGSWRHI